MTALSDRIHPPLDIELKLPREFRLRITHGSNADSVIGRRGLEPSVGSAPSTELVLPDAQVPAPQLTLQWRAGSYWIGQGGGGLVDRVTGNHDHHALVLRDASELTLGAATLRFELMD